MTKQNTANIGFEKEIWKAADLLRGNIDASEDNEQIQKNNTSNEQLNSHLWKRTKTRNDAS